MLNAKSTLWLKMLLAVFCLQLAVFSLFATTNTTTVATITITNAPTGTNGESLTIYFNGNTNGYAYTWTNLVVVGFNELAATNTAAQSATNLYTKLAGDWSGSLLVTYASSTSVKLQTYANGLLTAAISTNWGTLTIVTNGLGTNVSLSVSNLTAKSITLNGSTITSWTSGGSGTFDYGMLSNTPTLGNAAGANTNTMTVAAATNADNATTAGGLYSLSGLPSGNLPSQVLSHGGYNLLDTASTLNGANVVGAVPSSTIAQSANHLNSGDTATNLTFRTPTIPDTAGIATVPAATNANYSTNSGYAATATVATNGLGSGWFGEITVVSSASLVNGVTNSPYIFGPWLGPNYVQLAVNALPHSSDSISVGGGTLKIMGTNFYHGTLLVSNFNNGYDSYVFHGDFSGGGLVSDTNPAIRVQGSLASSAYGKVTFWMDHLFVSSLRNDPTNVFELLSGVYRFSLDTCWFCPWYDITNSGNFSTVAANAVNDSFITNNLVVSFACTVNDYATMDNCSFVGVAGVYWGCDHGVLTRNFFTSCGAANNDGQSTRTAWPTSSPISLGACITMLHADNFCQYNYFVTSVFSYSVLNIQQYGQGYAFGDTYEGSGGIITPTGGAVIFPSMFCPGVSFGTFTNPPYGIANALVASVKPMMSMASDGGVIFGVSAAGNGSGLTNLTAAVKAGLTNVSSATTVNIVFATPYADTNYAVSVISDNASGIISPYVSAQTASQFTLTFSSFTGNIEWTATHNTQ